MRLENRSARYRNMLAAASLSLSCSSGPRVPELAPLAAPRALVEGTATYHERIDMPQDAIFQATLLDVSRLDAPGSAVGYTVIVNPLPPPISFSIPFDTALINPDRNYAVRTRILADGRPLWISDRAYPVLTQGRGRKVNVTMRRTGATEDRTPEDSVVPLAGELTYLADVAHLTECSSRRIFPVSTEANFQAMLRTYLELAYPAGRPLYVTFEGQIANRTRPTGAGTTATVVVTDFVGAWPNQSCDRAIGTPILSSTPWRITVLNGVRLTTISGHEQPRLTVHRDSSGLHYSATVGCNGIAGNVEIDADRIHFERGTGTRKRCTAPLDSLEQQLRSVLDRAATWQVRANTLRFKDEAGVTLALFEPLSLR